MQEQIRRDTQARKARERETEDQQRGLYRQPVSGPPEARDDQ